MINYVADQLMKREILGSIIVDITQPELSEPKLLTEFSFLQEFGLEILLCQNVTFICALTIKKTTPVP